VDLLKSQEINLDYILELIFDKNKKVKSKGDLKAYPSEAGSSTC